jgi:hypothetical protein
MSVIYSFASLYNHGSLQDLLTFLALVSTASWAAVLLTTFVRFVAQAGYKYRSRRLSKESAYDS